MVGLLSSSICFVLLIFIIVLIHYFQTYCFRKTELYFSTGAFNPIRKHTDSVALGKFLQIE